MGLVRDWRRQMLRATGVSLIAPAALLVAALVVTAGGGGLGGLGGLGSLGQIASGPSLPETDLVAVAKGGSLGGAEVVAVNLTEAGVPRSAPAVAVARPDPGSATDRTTASDGGSSSGRDLALSPGGQPGSSVRTGPTGAPPALRERPPPVPTLSAPAPPPPAPAPLPSPAPPPAPPPAPFDPINQIIETTRDIGEALPGPVGPTTGNLLDTLDQVLGRRRP